MKNKQLETSPLKTPRRRWPLRMLFILALIGCGRRASDPDDVPSERKRKAIRGHLRRRARAPRNQAGGLRDRLRTAGLIRLADRRLIHERRGPSKFAPSFCLACMAPMIEIAHRGSGMALLSRLAIAKDWPDRLTRPFARV